MASRASVANQRHYEALAASPPSSDDELTDQQIQHRADIQWSSMTAEPGAVDYAEVSVAGRQALWIVPEGSRADQVLFYVHGGGFVDGSIYSHRKLVGHLAKAAGTKGLLVSYAMSRAQKFPAQQTQVMEAYEWLLSTGCGAGSVVVAADSAGVGALFGGMLLAKRAGFPMPAAALSISGWIDFSQSGKSYQANRERDAFFQKPTVDFLASLALGDFDAREASPLFADLTGMPPTYLQVGEYEALLDDSIRFAEALKAAGGETRIDVFPEMLHTFQMMAGFAPEADDAIARFASWVGPRLARRVPPER